MLSAKDDGIEFSFKELLSKHAHSDSNADDEGFADSLDHTYFAEELKKLLS